MSEYLFQFDFPGTRMQDGANGNELPFLFHCEDLHMNHK